MKEEKDRQEDVTAEVLPSTDKVNPFAIERAREEITLPSGRQVVILEMTASEESKLRELEKLRAGTALESVYESCTEGMTPEDLLDLSRGDRTYLMVKIRCLSYGTKYDFDLRCPSCGGTNAKTVDLSSMEIIHKNPEASDVITLPRTGWEVKLRPLNGRDEHKLAQYQKKTKEDLVAYELFLMLVTVNGKSRDAVSVSILKNLPAKDCVAIRQVIQEISDNVDTGLEMICSHCSYEFDAAIPITADFFFPDRA